MDNVKETLRFDYNNMMESYIGKKEGISEKELNSMKLNANEAHAKFKINRGNGMLGWVDLPYNQNLVIKDILLTAKTVRKAEFFVVLGIGGSALGPMALFQALCHIRYNDLKRSKRRGPKFFVEDNIDPERMQSLLDVLDLDRTVFNVVTKSGSTSETMSQFLIISDILKNKYGDDYRNHIIATTDEVNGNLIKIAKAEGFKCFYIPAGVGGRFSVISPVGLFPAAVLGINIKLLLKGCADMDKMCRKNSFESNPALIAATLQILAMKKGKNISVMMPYADSLKLMADWYCQLWGESLGKEKDFSGEKVNVGQTPVKALGVTDQHSQVQLYTEGPFDKVVTFLTVDKYRATVIIPGGFQDFSSISFLSGHTLNELITAEMVATEYALTKNERMNCKISIPYVDEYYVGQLMMFFMLQTAYCGYLLNIDAFNQPGVEEGKNATYALLGRKGYETKATELNSKKSKSNRYIIGK
ncbi:MAG: Glucose-6-phosphate isomerase [Firmicutes bacterium ADurb.Bin080]|jgi:glucose-6-phosphate isomerase|nr:glucose-6-phosphate isomerase [Clostridiales bacterium]OQC14588.1 MAG: Glucose-6-phosphate isomerase [Firmicutes bacterium ADurb.Bin080]